MATEARLAALSSFGLSSWVSSHSRSSLRNYRHGTNLVGGGGKAVEVDGGGKLRCGRCLLFDGSTVGDEGGVHLLPGQGGSVHRLVQVHTAAAIRAGSWSNPVVDRIPVALKRERWGR